MLPVLTLFAAWACTYLYSLLQSRFTLLATVPTLFICISTLIHGLSITRIYGDEDSRIVAKRWIDSNIPPGSHVLAEHGGFPTAWMVPSDQYKRRVTDSTYFINARDWILPSSQIAFFRERIAEADWVVLIEENRQKQFMSASNHYPIAANIYTQLDQNGLGFDRIAQFKKHPQLGPLVYNKNAEPTLTAFDHPTINIYQRKPEVSPTDLLNKWIEDIKKNPVEPDSQVLTGVQAFHQQNWNEARAIFEKVIQTHPTFALPHLLIAEIDLKQNDETSAQKHWDLATAQVGPISKYSFMGMIEAGLKSEGVIYLEDAAKKPGADPNLKELARGTYNEIGQEHQAKGDHDKATEAFARSITLAPDRPAAYVNAANSLIALGDLSGAQVLLTKAIQIDSTFVPTLQALARLYQHRNDLKNAYSALTKSLELDPQNSAHQIELFNLGSTFYQRGETQMAYTIFEKLLAHNPNFQEVHFNLGVLHLKAAEYDRALPHLQKATALAPEDVDAYFVLASLYEALSKTDDAIASYRRVLELSPNHNTARARLIELSDR